MNITETISFALKHYYEDGIHFLLKLLPNCPASCFDFVFVLHDIGGRSFFYWIAVKYRTPEWLHPERGTTNPEDRTRNR